MNQLSKNTSTLLFVMLTGMLVVVSLISYNKILQFNKSVEAIMHTNMVKLKIVEVGSKVTDAETGLRGYLLTGDSVFLQPYFGAERHNMLLFVTLDSLISNNALQQENLKYLKTIVAEKYLLMNTNLKFLKITSQNSFQDSALLNAKNKMDEVRKQVELMLQTEDKLLAERTRVKDRTATITPVFLSVLSLISIVVITLFFFRLQKETSVRTAIQVKLEVEELERKQIETIQQRLNNERVVLYNSFMNAPAGIAILKGDTHIFEFANADFEKLVGKKTTLGKTVREHFPEIEQLRYIQLLNNVFSTGEPFIADELPVKLNIKGDGILEKLFLNVVVQPLSDENGHVERIMVHIIDVTQQLNARKLIEVSEDRFRTLSETIPHMIWTATPDGKKNFFNKYFLDYTGLTFEELKGDQWQRIIFPDDLEIELAQWHLTIKSGEDFKFEKRIRHHSGTYRWHLSHSAAQRDNEGTIIGWIGSSTEIEDQKKFTKSLELEVIERTAELEERKNFVETILDTTKEYIAVYATDFTLIDLNKAVEIMMGKKREDLIGKKLFELIPNSKGSKLETDLQSVFNGDNIYNELFYSSDTGRYIENYITPLKDKQGNIYAALAIANDLTNVALKQKEIETVNQKLQLQNQTFELAESIAKFGSYTWNITSGALEYSDNLFRLLDCEPQEFAPSFERFLSFIHPDDLQQVINNGEQTQQTGVLVETPYRIISKTGAIKYFRSSGNFSGEGVNRILIGTVQDISKDVAATKEIKTKNLELENANAELSSFSYVASHDLQEPLRKIQIFSKRIIDKDGEKLSDTTKDYFKRIDGAAQRMQNLIESLLNFSRTTTTEIVFVKTDLNQIVNEVKAVLHETIKEKKAVIESENLPTLNAVPVQMQQLFLNLISNALKYSKHNVAPRIKITAEKVAINEIAGRIKQNGDFWKIVVSDNGIGFEQQYENKIFELFQRLHGKTEYEGTGIGLAICKKIVQTHNGIITATGKLGIGATFTFYLSDNNKS